MFLADTGILQESGKTKLVTVQYLKEDRTSEQFLLQFHTL